MGKRLVFLPEWVKTPLRRVRDFMRAVAYHGKGRWCPVCGRPSRRFRSLGGAGREEAECVHCGALERHRFLWLYFANKTDLFDGKAKTMLHVAAERCFRRRLAKRLGRGYVTADLLDPHAMVRMDVTDIRYPDESFDVVCCSHVLEHVPDDRRAMRELHRVLKRNGWAVFLVPITADRTVEDSSLVEAAERLRVFGQEDHVRRYGADFVDRLREAGFDVTVTRVCDLFNEEEQTRMGLAPADRELYYCERTSARGT